MLILLTSFTVALAMETPWDCPAPTSLEEMGAVEFVDAEGVWDAAYAEAWAWVDPACVVACGDGCEAADCTTGAGARVVYASREVRTDDAYDGSWSASTELTLTVTPPAGAETWSSLALDRAVDQGSDTYTYALAQSWTLSWAGSVDPAWPADETVSYGERSEDTYEDTFHTWSGSDSAGFTGSACVWATSSAASGSWDFEDAYRATRTVGAVEGEVEWIACGADPYGGYYRGVWNGVDVGSRDRDGWEPSGPTDADADGFSAEEDDCDDADPAAHFCAAEIWYDDADEACDGGDDHDQDGDGHAAASGGGGDCDDTDADVHPGARETAGDFVDADCDGAIDPAPHDTGDTGEPSVDTDTDTAAPTDTAVDTGAAPRPSAPVEEDAGCAAGGGGAAGGGAAVLLALPALFLRRRRQ